jgi:CRISPR-associated protein Cas1
MSVIYVTEQGAFVRKHTARLVVSKGKEILQSVPFTHVSQIVLFGNAQMTTQLVAYCLDNSIDVLFLTRSGRYRGRLQGDMNKHAPLRQKQYEKTLNASFRLMQSRAFVRGKISNMLAFARRHASEKDTMRMGTLARLLKQVETVKSVEELLGIEGAASASYFAMLGSWLPKGWEFERRVAHPPDGATNALLSLGYTLLYNATMSAIMMVGLDPYQGCFHTVRRGHAALASDLMEEFRPIIADAFVLKMLRVGIIRPKDIAETDDGWRLNADALAKFLTAFEERINSRRYVERRGERLSFRQILEHQARHYARIILDAEEQYQPFTLK